VLQEGLAAELSQHIDRIYAGINEIAEYEIDNAVLTAERDGGLSPFLGQWKKAGTLTSRQHDSQNTYAHSELNHAYSSKAPTCLQAKTVKPPTGSVDKKSGAIRTFSCMTSILGIVIVFACIAGGYLMEHGKLLVLIQPAELVISLVPR
jgi:hypothetical protein